MRELFQVIDGAPDIAPAHKRCLLGDLNRAFELVPSLSQARPNGRVVGPLLRRLHPLTAKVTLKRIQNIRASVRTALKIGYRTFPGAQHHTRELTWF